MQDQFDADEVIAIWNDAIGLDFGKIKRQFLNVLMATTAPQRVQMVMALAEVYLELEAMRFLYPSANREECEQHMNMALDQLKTCKARAADLGWDGSGAKLPRPFNRLFLERLFWQANLILLGPDEGKRPAILPKKREFEPFRY